MKPLKLNLKGFIGIARLLGLEEFELDCSQLRGIVALVGPNGSGKTTVLECMQPWRWMPSRKIGLNEAVHSRHAHKDLTMDWAGKIVRSLVTIDAQTGKSDGYLWVDGEPKSSGKVSEHDEELRKLIGPQDVFFNSVFAGQMVDSIFSSGVRPAKRKEFFVELLGLSQLQEYSERAKSVAGYLAGVLDMQRQSAERRRLVVGNIPILRKDHDVASEVVNSVRTKIQNIEAILATEMEELKRRELASADLDATRADLRKATESRKRLTDAREQREKAAREATDQLDRRIGTLERQEQSLRKDLLGGGAVEDIATLTARVEQYEIAHQQETEGKMELMQWNNKLLTAKAVEDARRREADKLEKLAEQIPAAAPRDICRGCGFAQAALSAPDEKKAAAEELEAASREFQPKIDAVKARLNGTGHKPVTVGMLQDARRALTMAQQREALNVKLENTQRIIEELNPELEARRKERDAIDAEYEPQVRQLDLAIAAYKEALSGDIEQALSEQRRTVKMQEEHLKEGRELLRKGEIELATIAANLDSALKMQQEYEALQAEIEKIDAVRSDWVFLQTVCGRDKLQALELDAAAPAITTYANDLLARCFGGRFTIQFETLDAKGREVFDLIVTDNGNGKSESLFLKSGGEKMIVQHALRLAIALYGKDRAGRNFQTLYLDESEAALAPETRFEFADMLRTAMRIGGFDLSLVVTHSTEVSDCADRIIRFGAGGIMVE